jgi:hypothetical protein
VPPIISCAQTPGSILLQVWLPTRITSEASQAPAPPAPNASHNTTSLSPTAPEDQAAPSDTVPTSDQPDPTAALAPVPHTASHTRLQAGISNPKIYKDSTVRYGNLTIYEEPTNISAALFDPNWKQAMESEFSALMRNNTWHLVPPVSGRNLIDCKWVFKLKRKADGSIDWHKDRLVAKGFKQ